MDTTLKSNVSRRATWGRALFMVLFGLIYSVAEMVLVAVVVFQFGSTLLTGKPSQRLLGFGQSLSTFFYQVLAYLTYIAEEKPFPFSSWPAGKPGNHTAAQEKSNEPAVKPAGAKSTRKLPGPEK